MPQDIGVTVAVEVRDFDDLPVRVGLRSEVGNAAHAVRVGAEFTDVAHEPDAHLPRSELLPNEIGGAVVIDVSDAGDLPAQIGIAGQIDRRLAVEVIDRNDANGFRRLSCVAKPRKAVGMRSDFIASASFRIGASFAGLDITTASDRHTPINTAAEAK